MIFYKISETQPTQVENDFSVVIVPPIFGANYSSIEYFNKILPTYNKSGKLLSPSELGCALSHISIYQKIIEKNEPAIIFESDIEPQEASLTKALKICASTTADFIHLGRHPNTAHGKYFRGKKETELDLYVIEPSRDFYGAFAYYISVRAARELLKYHEKSINLADSWAAFFLTSTLVPYHMPIFNHPPIRNEMHSERMSVNGNVYALSFTNLTFFVKKLLIQKLSFLKFWNKSITQDCD